MKLKKLRNVTVTLAEHGKYPRAYIKRKGGHGMKMSKFKKFQTSLERKGMSKDEAGGIAAKVGREKYGAKGMAKKAALGRKKSEAK